MAGGPRNAGKGPERRMIRWAGELQKVGNFPAATPAEGCFKVISRPIPGRRPSPEEASFARKATQGHAATHRPDVRPHTGRGGHINLNNRRAI